MQPQQLKPALAPEGNCAIFHNLATVLHSTAVAEDPSDEAVLGPAGVAAIWFGTWLAGVVLIAVGAYALNAAISYLVGGA